MSGKRRTRDLLRTPRWGVLIVMFLLMGGALLPMVLNGCSYAKPVGLYLSLRHAYFPVSLDPLRDAQNGWRLHEAYLELGVFDPDMQVFRDFARTLEVNLHEAALTGPAAALRAAPERLKRELPHKPRVLAWIYLHHADGNVIPAQLEPTTGASLAPIIPTFSVQNQAHRQALVEVVVELQRMGFDGVQLDLEPFPQEDIADFCALLGQLRSRTSPRFRYSVFTPKYMKNIDKARIHPGYVWDDIAPFQQLEPSVDQLMVPLYDYGALVETPEDYQQRVLEARDQLLPALNKPSQLWFALPAFRNTLEHGPAERFETALEVLDGRGLTGGGVGFFLYTGEPGETWYRWDTAQ